MTATEGGPALHGAGVAAPAGGGGSRGAARRRAPRLRMVLGLARVEASLLVRSALVLAGLLAGGLVIWLLIQPVEPLWWDAAWHVIGFGQLVLGMAVLVAGQLAAGRARRDAMADLYASCPATAGTRTLAHLVGLVGAVPASLLLIGATAAVAQVRGAIGVPSITALAGGLLLVIAAGAAGIAIGTRFPHPLAGVLGALVLFLTSGQSNRISGGAVWLLPWETQSDQLGQLPGPLAGYPPAGPHAAELTGIAVLAGIVALAVTVSRARARGGLATAGILAVAVICFAGALQLRPIPTADLNHLVAEVADPASVQRCTTTNQVRYCLYPGFGPELPSLEAPVNGVLARLPARPDQPLTVRQVVSLSLGDPTLTHGHPKRQVSQWNAQLQRAPGNAATASAIYLPVGSWPAAGARLTDAHFNVALATAERAVRIPPQATGSINSRFFLPCVPLDQAREAIAIWLAILATHPPASELQDGLGGLGPGKGITTAEVRNTIVRTWNYPGGDAGQVDPSWPGPQTTAAGYLLAHAMTSLPQPKVSRILNAAWATWMNWHTTDDQLAAALGIRMPSVPLPPFLRPGFKPRPGTTIAPGPGNGPQNPVCTT
jgi:hypothetical protein